MNTSASFLGVLILLSSRIGLDVKQKERPDMVRAVYHEDPKAPKQGEAKNFASHAASDSIAAVLTRKWTKGLCGWIDGREDGPSKTRFPPGTVGNEWQ